MVCWSSANRLDTGALHIRKRASTDTAAGLDVRHPAHLMVSDVARWGGIDYTTRTLAERQTCLQMLFCAIPATSLLALGMQTQDETTATEWLTTLTPLGVAGIIATPASATYRPAALVS